MRRCKVFFFSASFHFTYFKILSPERQFTQKTQQAVIQHIFLIKKPIKYQTKNKLVICAFERPYQFCPSCECVLA